MNDIIDPRGSKRFEKAMRPHMPDLGVFLTMHAYEISKYGHARQKRDDGRRYFDHPRAVAYILLVEFGVYDQEVIQAALMHDLMEDSYLLCERAIEHIFGSRVAMLVKLASKTNTFKGDPYWDRMFNHRDIGQIALKCGDRIHNMRTLGSCAREKQLKQVKETEEKLLSRLNDDKHTPFKTELERLCEHYKTSSEPAPLLPGQILWEPGGITT